MEKSKKAVSYLLAAAALTTVTTASVNQNVKAENDVKVTTEPKHETGKVSAVVLENEQGAVIRVTAHEDVQKVKTTYTVDGTQAKTVNFGNLTKGQVKDIQVNFGTQAPAVKTVKTLPNTAVVSDRVEFAKTVKSHAIKGSVSFEYETKKVLAIEPDTPVVPTAPKPTDSVKPVKPVYTTKPVAPTKPVDTVKPTEPTKPVDVTKPAEPVKPVDTTKPTEPAKPVETPKPKEQPKPVVTTPTPKPTPAATATYYNGVKATLLNAYRAGQKSMGDAALEHSNVTVYKEGNTYHYIVRFHDLSTQGFTGGISKFWVNGTEYAVNPTGGSNNQVEVHFTSTEKLSSVPVTVFVQAMEDIMQGGGKQDATLAFDWSSVSEQQGQPIAGGTPGSSGYTPQPTKPAKDPGKKSPTSPIKPIAKPNLMTQDQGQGEEKTVTYFDNVTVSLLNAYESGRASMGNAALDGITVYKDGSTYHYIVRFHDIKVGTLTDGITRFWVNGTEYPVTSTGGAMNQVQVHFTSSEQLTNIPVSVFVPTMESIMPGAGKKDAILSLNWSNATERQGTAVIDGGQPGSSASGNRALTPKGGRLNNGRLSNTGLETSSSILAGALTLISAVLVGRRKQK